jgi:hypothetical protein
MSTSNDSMPPRAHLRAVTTTDPSASPESTDISHGGDSVISLPTMQQYRDSVFRLFAYLCDLLDPKST